MTKVRTSPRKSKRISKQPTKSASPRNAAYEVKAITDHKYIGGKLMFRVSWVGYKPEDDTWLPKRNLSGSKDMLKQYMETHNVEESDRAEEEYEVEAIVAHQKRKSRTYYQVKWVGYDSSNNTWQLANTLKNAPEILEEYKKANGL